MTTSATDDTDKVIPPETWAAWYAHPCTKRLVAKLEEEIRTRNATAAETERHATQLFLRHADDSARYTRRDADEWRASASVLRLYVDAIQRECGVPVDETKRDQSVEAPTLAPVQG